MRLKIKDYFFYSIVGGDQIDVKSVKSCLYTCPDYQRDFKKCCAEISFNVWDDFKERYEPSFQYHCINQAIAEANFTTQIDKYTVDIQCVNRTWSGAKNLIANTFASIIGFIVIKML